MSQFYDIKRKWLPTIRPLPSLYLLKSMIEDGVEDYAHLSRYIKNYDKFPRKPIN